MIPFHEPDSFKTKLVSIINNSYNNTDCSLLIYRSHVGDSSVLQQLLATILPIICLSYVTACGFVNVFETTYLQRKTILLQRKTMSNPNTVICVFCNRTFTANRYLLCHYKAPANASCRRKWLRQENSNGNLPQKRAHEDTQETTIYPSSSQEDPDDDANSRVSANSHTSNVTDDDDQPMFDASDDEEEVEEEEDELEESDVEEEEDEAQETEDPTEEV